MKTYSFKVVVEPGEDAQGNSAWHAYCPALESVGGATSGRTREEALSKINEVIHMIVQEFVEEGKPLPEGPEDSVEIEDVSQEQPRIAVTVSGAGEHMSKYLELEPAPIDVDLVRGPLDNLGKPEAKDIEPELELR